MTGWTETGVHGAEWLSPAECERHLRSEIVCRVAVSTPSGPHIVPVNYAVVDDAIVILTSRSSLLARYGEGGVVGIEIDGVSPTLHAGWSVVARGHASASAPSDFPGLRSWMPGPHELLLRMPLADCEISGRILRPRAHGRD